MLTGEVKFWDGPDDVAVEAPRQPRVAVTVTRRTGELPPPLRLASTLTVGASNGSHWVAYP